MKTKDLLHFFELFIIRFQDCKTSTWAASVAFYTALSLAPVLVIFLALSPMIDESLKATFINELQQLVGSTGANAVAMILSNAEQRIDLMSISGLIGAVTLMISASLVFGELRSAFSEILQAYPAPPTDPSYFHYVWVFLKSRIFQMGLALGFVFILIASLIVSTTISALLRFEHSALGEFSFFINAAISFFLYIGIFLVIFRFLPQSRIPWREATESSILTSALFVIGKEFVGNYLASSFLSSSYGAAGSVIILLAWVYYSSLIIFVGAHVSYIMQTMRRRESEQKPSLPPPEDEIFYS
ncbi:YihY/virulence factor BrkB family protein [Bdellovibrio sp. HCB2-146]|uniref:YihY/virulence factor BrkB family protein n=1 Tax=Bdellovibrio sp. HCB2-146 TaxID=3394362 RepID=UPI0039BCCA34